MNDQDIMTDELQILMDEIESQRDPDDNEIQAYARTLNRIQADEDAINARYTNEVAKLDANHAKMLKGVENRRKAIEWKWGEMVRCAIFAKLKGKKQQFIDTLFGRVGFRKTPAKVKRIYRSGFDMATALAWAKANCPDAVNTKETQSITINALPEDCPQIWVENVESEQKFYWKPNKKGKNDEQAKE
ncbi:MAG: hypothetical protein GY807_24825 [Gammaproteobacteria bacterium]|nr:hypothetical protein [Gammaproteobacteria bacterium]